jgi:hypothetical protein
MATVRPSEVEMTLALCKAAVWQLSKICRVD